MQTWVSGWAWSEKLGEHVWMSGRSRKRGAERERQWARDAWQRTGDVPSSSAYGQRPKPSCAPPAEESESDNEDNYFATPSIPRVPPPPPPAPRPIAVPPPPLPVVRQIPLPPRPPSDVKSVVLRNVMLRTCHELDDTWMIYNVAEEIGPLTTFDKNVHLLSPGHSTACCGLNGRIQVHLVTKPEFHKVVRDLKAEVVDYMASAKANPLKIALACNGSKHRSIATLVLLKEMLEQDYSDIPLHVDLRKKPWRRCGCPGDCESAGGSTYERTEDHVAAVTLMRRLWVSS